MLICFKVFMEWLETKKSWNLKNYGFSICIGSITCWTNWDDFVAITIGCVGSTMDITSLIDTTCSILMLLIIWCRLGSGSSLMLPCVAVTLSFYPPLLPISFEHVCSSSSSKSITDDSKVLLDFFLGGEITSSRLNLSLGVGSSIRIFIRWD